MSPCLVRGGGGATTYMLESLDLESIKSPSSTTTTSWISNSTASPSSESGSPVAVVSTRKPRTPRKRPNQTYNEAAALLATAYPKIFSPPINNTNNSYFTKPPFSYEPDLLLDSTAHGLSLHMPNCSGPNNLCEKAPFELDFDAESIILDGEELMGEGIDCIMGNNFTANHHRHHHDGGDGSNGNMEIEMEMQGGFCYGYPVGLGFQIGEIGMRKETMRAIRNGDKEGDWWRFPTVNAIDSAAEKRRKKKAVVVVEAEEEEEEFVVPRLNAELLLKLNHDAVLEAWTNKASPFSDDVTVAGSDVKARLAQIDLFGGMREASVLRYKEKRQNRLFSKKIRYQVRKVNADRRPRMKGRFVRTQNSKYSDG